MKTYNDIKKEINSLINEGLDLKGLSEAEEKKERARIVSRIKYLRPLLNYLEKNPSEVFVKSDLGKTENILASILKDAPTNGELKKEYYREREVSKFKTHIKNLEFILS